MIFEKFLKKFHRDFRMEESTGEIRYLTNSLRICIKTTADKNDDLTALKTGREIQIFVLVNRIIVMIFQCLDLSMFFFVSTMVLRTF